MRTPALLLPLQKATISTTEVIDLKIEDTPPGTMAETATRADFADASQVARNPADGLPNVAGPMMSMQHQPKMKNTSSQ